MNIEENTTEKIVTCDVCTYELVMHVERNQNTMIIQCVKNFLKIHLSKIVETIKIVKRGDEVLLGATIHLCKC